MEKIIWDEKYSVGVKELDKQHQLIFDSINLLIENRHISVRSERITYILSKMTEYFWTHLDNEERYMKEYGYPDYKEHVTQHINFKKKISFLNLDTMDHKSSVPEDLLLYLKEWWSNHILKVDMRYRSFFNERGLK